MRPLIKFLHTIGAIGMMGAMACLLVLLAWLPEPQARASHAALRAAMGGIATWIFLPSLALTLVAGLLAMAATRAYQNAGWALTKLATGILLFEGGFAGVVGPMQDAAERSQQALAGAAEATLAPAPGAERNTLVVLMAIAVVNVALGVWRPRLTRRKA
jgi:uncharacterized membrane protein